MVKCEYCGEEMIEMEYVDLGYGNRHVEYDCPNNCELIEWLDEQNELAKRESESE